MVVIMNIFSRQKPIKMLIGTDWWTDCDDAVAMRILTRAHKKEMIEILGIGMNACTEYSAVSLDAFMRSEGLPNIEIGIDHDATDFGGHPPYQERLSKLPSKYKSNLDCDDAVLLYRRILAKAEEKIDIIEIGFPQILSNLLLSKPDDSSDLSGAELVLQKVNKLWVMAGKWDDLETGTEHNFAHNKRARVAANYLCQHWPTPITFLGWEISNEILTGDNLKKDDILYNVLCDHGSPNGRSSWDPMLVLMACINDEKQAGYSTVCGTAFVESDTGMNHFSFDSRGLHKFVVKDFCDDFYKQAINDIIATCVAECPDESPSKG